MGNVTYQTLAPESIKDFCNALSALLTQVERDLYADIQKGININQLKRDYQSKYGINARQFNAVHTFLKGKIKSREQCLKLQLNELETKITDIKTSIKALEKRFKSTYSACSVHQGWKSPRRYVKWQLHQKKRRLKALQYKLKNLLVNKPPIIFGSRRLWNAQFNLEDNGYRSHKEWLADWRRARSAQFSFVGSKDETAGCQVCQLDIDGTLLIRVPYRLESQFGEYITAKKGVYIKATGVQFSYGQEDINWALEKGQSLSFRFVYQDNKWYIFCTTERPSVPYQSHKQNGMLGVDLNPGVIGWAYCDPEGNLKAQGQIRVNLRDRSSHQVKATLGEVVKELVSIADQYKCPITIENLDFTRKKARIREQGVRYSRMLSNFAYSNFDQMLGSRAQRYGIQVIHVNPAYTSLIGLIKFMRMYGLSSDTAAALVLARRSLYLSERIPANYALVLPEDKTRHVWSHWNKLGKKLKGVKRHAFFLGVANSDMVVNLPCESKDRLGGKSFDTSIGRRDSVPQVDSTARSAPFIPVQLELRFDARA